MKKHEILSSQARAALFDPPTDPAAIVRHYTFSPADMALIRQRRRAANRLGFAIHLAYLRFPGRAPRPEETPPAEMLTFISAQIGCEPEEFASYARRSEPRWEALVHNLRSGGSGGAPGGFRRAFERRACRERSCG